MTWRPAWAIVDDGRALQGSLVKEPKAGYIVGYGGRVLRNDERISGTSSNVIG